MSRYLCIAPSQYFLVLFRFIINPGFGVDSSGACLMNKCALYEADVEMNSFFGNLPFCRPAFFYISIGLVLLYFPLVVVYSLILAGFCGKGECVRSARVRCYFGRDVICNTILYSQLCLGYPNLSYKGGRILFMHTIT